VGVIRGINPGNEPLAKGYLHGQLWNRPTSQPGKWIIFRVIQSEVSSGIEWLDGAVITPHPPAVYLGQFDPGNIKPFGAIKCDVYTGEAPVNQSSGQPLSIPRVLPAGGAGFALPQQVSWEQTLPIFQNGFSITTIGINTTGVSSRYLHFDFLGEFFKSMPPVFDLVEMIPRRHRILVYTADSFPTDTTVDSNDLFSAPIDAIPIAKAESPQRGVWLVNGYPATGMDYNYFSMSGLLFIADTITLENSRFSRQYFDADASIIPNRYTSFWNGGQSSDASGSVFHWDLDTSNWEVSF
jgi:hypothetical protein